MKVIAAAVALLLALGAGSSAFAQRYDPTTGYQLVIPQSGGSTPPAVSVPAATTDASSTIVTGGTFQQIAASSATRKSFEFTNICTVTAACTGLGNYCYLFFAASGSPSKTTNAIPVPPGSSYLRSSGNIPSDALQATCDGTGDHYRLAVQ